MLSAISERACCDAVSVAFHYHSGKLLQPHLPRPRTHFSDTNGVQFRPTLERYRDIGIQPNVSALARERDIMREIRTESDSLGLALIAWIVCLHTSGQGTRRPDTAQQTVYGDPLTYSLCPSHPDVQEYVKRLVVDAAVTYEPEAIELESLEFLPFSHGHHHELSGVALDPYHDFLLGLDFNPHTEADMELRGVDVARVRDLVRRELDRFFAGYSESTGAGLDHLVQVLLEEPEMAAFMRARMAIITDLLSAIAHAVRSASQSKVHAILSMWRPVHVCWADGYSPAAIAPVVDRIGLPAYYQGDQAVHEVVHLNRWVHDLSKVTALVDAGAPLVTSEADLAAMTQSLLDAGIRSFSFYNYSLVREATLDWIRRATRGAGATAS